MGRRPSQEAGYPYALVANQDGAGEPVCWTIGGLTGLLGVTVFATGGSVAAGAALLLIGSGIGSAGRLFRN